MKKTHYNTFPFLLFFAFLLYSCERNITVDIPDSEEKLVMEGAIEQEEYPMVFLTKNLPYFGVVDSAAIIHLIVQEAVVIVSDGITTDTLQKTFDFNYFPPIYFKGTKIKGEAGKTYFLTVIAEGKTYTAETAILSPPIGIDSLWFETDKEQDSLGYLWAIYNDPPEPGNYYRLYAKRLKKDNIFIPVLGSIYDDKFFNGQEFTFSMIRGVSNINSTEKDPEYGYFKIGDTIISKFTSIDKASYDFWRSAEGEMYSNGNPFLSPSQIVTNIKGGALGVWTGYGVFTDTVICK